ncbi:uncharacterized protein YukJ [Arthrobacter sp. OAP107]
MQRVIGDAQAVLYVFGERFGPEPGIRDKVFGFDPGNGVAYRQCHWTCFGQC